MQCAQRGALAGSIAVEAQHRLGRKTPQFVQLHLGQGGAERRHRAAKTGAVQRDHIHIAFDDDGRGCAFLGTRDVGARLRPGVEHAALLEQRRIRRIEVFRLVVAHCTGAERNGTAGTVADRKHDATAEIVVRNAAVLGEAQQPGLGQQRLRVLGGERAAQRLAVIGRPAEPEAAHRLLVEIAAGQVFAGPRPGRRP